MTARAGGVMNPIEKVMVNRSQHFKVAGAVAC